MPVIWAFNFGRTFVLLILRTTGTALAWKTLPASIMDEYLQLTYTIKEIDFFISSNAEESINLDFKRGDALRKGIDAKDREKIKSDIAKDVSSFANSDGGIIVYGIEEKHFKAHKLHFVNGNEFTKETLEQIINTRIHRKIDGLIIDPIRYEDKIDQTIFVVKIPRSANAPHMTSDNKFYRRYNFESVAMEEYEVRNLYSRQDKTELSIVTPTVSGFPSVQQYQKYVKYLCKIIFNIQNDGQTIEKLYKLEIRIPKQIAQSSNTFGGQVFFKSFVRFENGYSIYSLPNSSPLFQNEFATIGIAELDIMKHNVHEVSEVPINIRLFYSHGTKEYSFLLSDHLKGPDGETLNIKHFAD